METDVYSVSFKTADGHRLPFSESLIAFLAGRKKVGRFAVGSWLASLSDVDLQAFMALGERWAREQAGEIEATDFVGVLINAWAAEKNFAVIKAHPEEVIRLGGQLGYVCSIEVNRRRGFIEITRGAPRLFPFQGDACVVTEAGLSFSHELKKNAH